MGGPCPYIPICLGASPPHDLPSPLTLPLAMSPKDVDPSTLKLNERTLSKIPKKALAEHLTALQEMYEMRGRKYGM